MLHDGTIPKRVRFEDDPNRCQATSAGKQCRFEAAEGQSHCTIHLGVINRSKEQKATKLYKLVAFQTRLTEIADSDAAKTNAEELAILRMLLEEQVNSCKTSTDLILNGAQIRDSALAVTAMLKNLQQFEDRNSLVIDEKKAREIVEVIVSTVTQFITDPDTLEALVVALDANLSTLFPGKQNTNGNQPTQPF
jgi:hypothetical protein